MASPRRAAWAGMATAAVALVAAAVGVTTSHVNAASGDKPSDSPAQHVDFLLAQELNLHSTATGSAGLAPTVDDNAYLRRVSLDLVGRLPTPTDIATFALDPAADKRSRLVESLLADERYGRNWARYWRDVILYRRAEDRALIGSRAAEEFFTEAFNNNVGWDQITRSILESTGDVYTSGNTLLYMSQMAEATDVASEVSRIFMGVQISCAQCHDHPTDRWKREQFHEFAAFFPRLAIRPVYGEGRVRSFELVGRDFGGPSRPGQQGRGALEHRMPDLKDPSAEGKLMTPAFFVTGQTLPTGTPDADRRATIADWITSSQDGWFAKSFVNRIWAELVGEGFYEPVDDLGPDRPCTAPKTLDYLAQQFVSHRYDVKWLLRTIMATDAYQRESRPRRLPNETPFLANCSHRLRSDQVYDNLEQALGTTSLISPGNGGQGLGRLFGSPRMVFGNTFGYDPSVRRDEIAGSIPQALMLMNGPQLNAFINGRNHETMLGKMLADIGDNREAVVELYLRCLAREPNEQELNVSLDHVRSTRDRAAAFEDLQWTLVNRTEFLYRN